MLDLAFEYLVIRAKAARKDAVQTRARAQLLCADLERLRLAASSPELIPDPPCENVTGCHPSEVRRLPL